MRISPTIPAPLKALFILGIGCVLAGMELAEPVVTPVRRKPAQAVAAEQHAAPTNPAPSMASSPIRSRSAAALQNAFHMAESAPHRPQDRR